MKKAFLLILLSLLILGTACAKLPAASEIMAELDGKFGQEYGSDGAVWMPQTLTAEELNTALGLSEEDYSDFAATISLSNTRSDSVYMIRADKKSVEKVVTALESKRSELIMTYQENPVDGSYERAVASVVFTEEHYVFFLCVGVLPEDTDQMPDFDAQVAAAKAVVESFFSQ